MSVVLWHRKLAVTRPVSRKHEIAFVAGSARAIRFPTSRALAGERATFVIAARGGGMRRIAVYLTNGTPRAALRMRPRSCLGVANAVAQTGGGRRRGIAYGTIRSVMGICGGSKHRW